MTPFSVADAILIVLVYVELVRFMAWALNRLGSRLDARQERQRLADDQAQFSRTAERSHLVDVGNVAKIGLLRNAGVIHDDFIEGEVL